MKAWRKASLLLAGFACWATASAQLVVQLNVNPTVSPFLYEWEGASANDLLVIVDNLTMDEVPAVFQAQLFDGSGTELGFSVPGGTPLIFIPPGNSVYPLAELIPIEALDYTGELPQSSIQSGQLPDGDYLLCLNTLDPELFQPIAETTCAPFMVLGFQDPWLLYPANGDVISPELVPNLVFQWSPVMPIPEFGEIYIFSLYEVYPGQALQEAVQVNPSIVQEEVLGITQFVYPMEFLPLESEQGSYAWTVSAVDLLGQTYTTPNGVSEPYGFTVDMTGVVEPACECIQCNFSGLQMFVNGQPVNTFIVPTQSAVSFQPQYEIICAPPDCPASFQGQITANYSSQSHPNQQWVLQPGEEITLPGNGLLYLTWEGTGFCGESPCECTGNTGPTQWQVQSGVGGGDVVGDPDLGDEIVGGGESDTDGECVCVNCTLESMIFLQNGEPVTSHILPTGAPLSFSADWQIECAPEDCEPSVSGYFQIGYTPVGGSWTAQQVSPGEEFVIPHGIGIIIVDFVGTASCNGSVCQCSGANGLEIFTGAPIMPPPETEEPPDSIPPPPPEDPPGPKPKSCDAIVKSLNPAMGINLGMTLDEPDKFLYPRAVPLQAEGVDWDYVELECSGCDAEPSKLLNPVRDRMDLNAYEWRIVKGLGSLNTPFQVDSILKAQEALRELEEQLKALLEKQSELEQRLNEGISADSLRFAGFLQDAKSNRDLVQDKLDQMIDSIAGAEQLLLDAEEALNEQTDSLTTVQGLIEELEENADTLEVKLMNLPEQEELDALQNSENKKAEYETAKEAVDDYEAEMADAAQDIADNLEDLRQQSNDNTTAYLNQRDIILSLARHIDELEAQVYYSPALQAYRMNEMQWQMRYNHVYLNFVSGTPAGYTWEQTRQDIKQQMQQLASTVLANREDMYEDLHSDLMSFIPLPQGVCATLNEPFEQCPPLASALITATHNLDTAMAQMNDSPSVLDLALLETLHNARDSLEQIKSGLDACKQAATSASEAYHNAMEASIGQLAALEENKKTLLEALADKAVELAEAEAVYMVLVRARETYFQENRKDWETELAAANDELQKMRSVENEVFDEIALHTDTVQQREIELEILEFEKSAIEDELAKFEALVAKLEAKLEALQDEPAEVEQQLADLEGQIEALKDEIAEAQKELNKLSAPKRTASGPQVYYNPPPLEEILELHGKTPIFDSLVAAVEEAKAEVRIAYAEKAAVQGRIAKLIDKSAWDWLVLRHSSDQIEALESLIADLEEEKAGLELEVAESHLENQQALQDKEDSFITERDNANDKVEQYELAEDDLIQKEISIKEQMENLRMQREEREEALKTARAGMTAQEKLFRNAANTLAERSREVREQQQKIIDLEKELGAKQNERTLAYAGGDSQLAEDLNDVIEDLESQVEQERTALEQLRTDLAAIESSHEALNTALVTATQEYSSADSLLRLTRAEYAQAEDSLLQTLDDITELLGGKTYWEFVASEAERLIKKVQNAQAEYQDVIGEEIDEHPDVQAIDAQIEAAEADKVAHENRKTQAQQAIEAAVDEKDNWIKEADEQLEKALKDLEDAQEELREFLLEEFNSVEFEVKLELAGDDEVCDGWRSDDAQAKIINDLNYKGSRLPVMENIHATGTLPEVPFPNPCQIQVPAFEPPPDPDELLPPTPTGPEPRNVSLMYDNGRPLWPEWPIIPQDESRYLQYDVLFLRTEFTPDFDEVTIACQPPPDCDVTPPLTGSILDVRNYRWEIDHQVSKNQNLRYATWETAEVPIPKPEEEQELKSFFHTDDFAGDPEVKSENEVVIYPGVLIEVPDTIFGKPDTTREVSSRVVRGGHKGLPGEKVEFIAELVAGKSENWGFGGEDTIEVSTDGMGYAKADFDFGDGYALFNITVKWYRGDQVIEQDQFAAIAPLKVHIHRLGPGPPEPAWVLAADYLDGRAQGDIAALSEQLPSCVYDGEEEISDDCLREMRGVAGLVNHFSEFVIEEHLDFEIADPDITLHHETDSTDWFGLGRTLLKDVGEDVESELTASIHEDYLPVGRPGKHKRGFSTERIEEFYIGESELPFLVLLDEPVLPGEVINGTGMLGVSAEGMAFGVMIPLQSVKLQLSDISLEKQDGKDVAISGEVKWSGEGSVQVQILAFEIGLNSLAIAPEVGATIGGSLSHETALPDPVEFSATMNPEGDFIGRIGNLPEISVMDFTLKQGASIEIDMHSNAGPGPSADWKGVFIKSASLELPDQFSRAKTDIATVLTATNFYIGPAGIGGKLELDGSFFEVGYGGYALEGRRIMIEFTDQELQAFELGGRLHLASPFEGKIDTEIGYSGEAYYANVSTEHPVSIPRLKTVFHLLPNTGIILEDTVYTLRLNAMVKSKHIGDITVNNLKYSTLGEISAENISLTGDISFGRGFRIQNPSLAFEVNQEEYRMDLTGVLVFPMIDGSKLGGTVSLMPGPSLAVQLDSASFTLEFSAVRLAGGFRFNGNEFRGDFDVGLRNMSAGISGLFLVGTHAVSEEAEPFTYWYAELSVPVTIPLGQTGLSILKLGGGLGQDYFPPMGDQGGHPVADGGFAFKVLMGMGNTPQGEIFAAEMQMALAASMFSLYGRAWLLKMRKTFYGEGRLNLAWEPEAKLDGFVRMVAALPGEKGELLNFDGKIIFLYSPSDFYIKSEQIGALLLSVIQASAEVNIDNQHLYLAGEISLGYNGKLEFSDWVGVEVDLGVKANASLEYVIVTKTLSAEVGLHGNWRVTILTSVKDFNLLAGAVEVDASLIASPNLIKVDASVEVTWDFWVTSGEMEVPIGFEKNL